MIMYPYILITYMNVVYIATIFIQQFTTNLEMIFIVWMNNDIHIEFDNTVFDYNTVRNKFKLRWPLITVS